MHSGARADPPARRLLALFNINTLRAMAVPCLLRGLRPARPFFLIGTRFSPQLQSDVAPCRAAMPGPAVATALIISTPGAKQIGPGVPQPRRVAAQHHGRHLACPTKTLRLGAQRARAVSGRGGAIGLPETPQ